jgi:hypothetical protein
MRTTDEAELRMFASFLIDENPVLKTAVITIAEALLAGNTTTEVKIIADKDSPMLIKGYNFAIYYSTTKLESTLRELIKANHNSIRLGLEKYAKVNLQQERIVVKTKDGLNIIIHYLPFSRFRAMTYGIPSIKTINENKKAIITLVKYWKTMKHKKNISSLKIEKIVVESKYDKFMKIFGELLTILKFEQEEVKEYLLSQIKY